MPLILVDEARRAAREALACAGVSEANAAVQCELLIEAELRGFASHGLLRLPRILKRIENGVIDPDATGTHEWRAPGFLHVAGNDGLGPVVAMKALEAAIERVSAQGIVAVAIAQSNHLGMLAFYAEKIAIEGKALIAFSTSEALVHPWGGRHAMIGTNPIAFGIPTGGDPLVVDAATSLVSMGKIHDYANRNEAIPEGWALDEYGRPTTDPNLAKRGAIAPFGGPKGYALGLAFEMLVSALSGAAIGLDVKGTLDATEKCNKGDLFIIIESPPRDLTAYLEAIRVQEPHEGFSSVRVPGDRSRAQRIRGLKEGIDLPQHLWTQIQNFTARRVVGTREGAAR